MATKTPIPPGPPPRGFQWPDQPPSGTITPLGSGPTSGRTVVVQPGRHGVTVFVGIVALVIGLIFGFQLGEGAGTAEDASANSDAPLDAPTVTTSPPTTPTTGSEGPASLAPLGTLENPIPLGQTWILGVWQLRVISADFDAADTVVEASRSNPIPDDGSTYVLVDIELTLVDDLFASASDFTPGLEAADGTEFPNIFADCGPAIPDDFYDNGRLRTDEPIHGNLCFEIPIEATDGLLLTTDGVAETTTYFALEET